MAFMKWPERVWYETGKGWASRIPTKADKERRDAEDKRQRERMIRRAAQ